jgi:hypothetical protein
VPRRIAIVLVLALLAACSGGDDDDTGDGVVDRDRPVPADVQAFVDRIREPVRLVADFALLTKLGGGEHDVHVELDPVHGMSVTIDGEPVDLTDNGSLAEYGIFDRFLTSGPAAAILAAAQRADAGDAVFSERDGMDCIAIPIQGTATSTWCLTDDGIFGYVDTPSVRYEIVAPREWLADLEALSADDMEGRDNDAPGGARARRYLVDRLREIGVVTEQPFGAGVNVLAVIPGTELPEEHVILGAHYDHLGSDCRMLRPDDTICNGATDNAAGVAAVLEIGRRLASEPVRRSVVLALWDAEEDGLLGSRSYVRAPLVPLDATTVYLNWDNLGSNLLPSLTDLTVMVGSETGGAALVDAAVAAAESAQGLQPILLSLLFGQGRSDHAVFADAGVPTVFTTDATGGCYHTTSDDIDAVDVGKLARQIDLGEALARSLADTDTPPSFVTGTPPATHDDAAALLDVLERAEDDTHLLRADAQPVVSSYRADLEEIVDAGARAFDDPARARLLGGAVDLVLALADTECNAYVD